MREYDDDDQTKEVYARFGLALYYAQVLEHGLVNALVALNLIPERRHLAKSSQAWAKEVDAFMDEQFESTMGQLLRDLRTLGPVPKGLDIALLDSLRSRNWLAHGFFRDRAEEFMSMTGRTRMCEEVDACRALFQESDRQLEVLVGPIREKYGISEKMLEYEYQRMLASTEQYP